MLCAATVVRPPTPIIRSTTPATFRPSADHFRVPGGDGRYLDGPAPASSKADAQLEGRQRA